MQNTTLYRAVSFDEFTQLLQTGRFEIVGNSVEGKYFAENQFDAMEWGERLFGSAQYRVVAISLPATVASEFYRMEHLDGIGPARFADMQQLDEGVALSIREANDE